LDDRKAVRWARLAVWAVRWCCSAVGGLAEDERGSGRLSRSEGIFLGFKVGVNELGIPTVTVHTINKSGRRRPDVQ